VGCTTLDCALHRAEIARILRSSSIKQPLKGNIYGRQIAEIRSKAAEAEAGQDREHKSEEAAGSKRQANTAQINLIRG
jgi:hypothetical protein